TRRVALFLLLNGLLATGQCDAECFLSPYINEFDIEFSFQCPAQYVIAGMSSYHSNHHEDRCGNSQWSLYVNSFEEDFQWTVPPHNVLVGVECYHQDFQEWVQFLYLLILFLIRNVRLCDLKNCHWTSHVNWFDETFYWNVPHHNVLVGHQDFQE
uniref:Si:dkey-14d8.6 n=1 Tax=Sinocyclocheilus grahami TaxID=75366 RepID=A0A672RW19_SINGR